MININNSLIDIQIEDIEKNKKEGGKSPCMANMDLEERTFLRRAKRAERYRKETERLLRSL